MVAESGVHLAAAYAPIDGFAIRARGQKWRFEPDSEYWIGAVGAETFQPLDDHLMFSIAAEVGYGRVDAFDEVTILSSTERFSSNGALMQFAVPMTLGWHFKAIRVGLGTRILSHTIFNDLSWSGRTQGTLLIVEEIGFFRIGKPIAFETQAGASFAMYRGGDIPRGYFPFHIGIGVSLDLDFAKD